MINHGLLKGNRVKLTAIEEEDIKTIASWYSDADFLRYFDKVPACPKTEQQLTEWINKCQTSNNCFPFAIRSVEDNRTIGYIELDNVQWWNGVANLGIGIGSKGQRGKGYGREAMELLLEFAFNEINLHRVQLNVFSYNERAIMLYEKVGFQREGCYREFVHKDGQYFDMYLYSILSHEWKSERIKY